MLPPSQRLGPVDLAKVSVFAALFLILWPAEIARTYYGMAGVAAVLVGWSALFVVGVALARSARLDWDGREVTLGNRLSRRVIGVAGAGQIVRADLAHLSDGKIVPTLYWLDDSGALLGSVIEDRWDADALASLIAQSRIPMTDVGAITVRQLADRYPATLPSVARFRLGAELVLPDHEPRVTARRRLLVVGGLSGAALLLMAVDAWL